MKYSTSTGPKVILVVYMFGWTNHSVIPSGSAHACTFCFDFLIGSWLISLVLIATLCQSLFSLAYFNWELYFDLIYKSVVSLFFCLLIVPVAIALDQPKGILFTYVLFFS